MSDQKDTVRRTRKPDPVDADKLVQNSSNKAEAGVPILAVNTFLTSILITLVTGMATGGINPTALFTSGVGGILGGGVVEVAAGGERKRREQSIAQALNTHLTAAENNVEAVHNLLAETSQLASENHQAAQHNLSMVTQIQQQMLKMVKLLCKEAQADLQKVRGLLLQEDQLVQFRALKTRYTVLEKAYDTLIAKNTLVAQNVASTQVFLQSFEQGLEEQNTDATGFVNSVLTAATTLADEVDKLEVAAQELRKMVETFLHDAVELSQADTTDKDRAAELEQQLKGMRNDSTLASKNAKSYTEAMAMLEQSHELNAQLLFTLRGWQKAMETLAINLPPKLKEAIVAIRSNLVAQNVSVALIDMALPASDTARDHQIALRLMVIPELNDINTLEDVEAFIEHGVPENHGSIQYKKQDIGTVSTQQVSQMIGKMKLGGVQLAVDDFNDASREIIVFIGTTESDINALKGERSRNPDFFSSRIGSDFFINGGNIHI